MLDSNGPPEVVKLDILINFVFCLFFQFSGEPPFELVVGSHSFVVRAQDHRGNSAFCNIVVQVISKFSCTQINVQEVILSH